MEFNLPAQPATEALLAFSRQARMEVLFSFDQLREVQSNAVAGSFEPENALVRLLGETGFGIQRNRKGKFVVSRTRAMAGAVQGRLLLPGDPATSRLRVTLLEARRSVLATAGGEFIFERVPPGTYGLVVTGEGYERVHRDKVVIEAGRTVVLEPLTLQKTDGLTRLDPYIVQGKSQPPLPFARDRDALPPRTAVGNLDLARTENDALPYTIYDREQILRSGVVGLNEFLQRAVLEGEANAPEAAGSDASLPGGSQLRLRGFGDDETVVLVNGRRLPEVLTSESRTLGPDVNYIPLSLIQQVEVLPVSASALYSGNAVGGVINIVLRPNLEATEVNFTYTNAVSGFDAPQSSASLLHGQSLLDGKLQVRFNASVTRSTPPAESELGYHRAAPPTVRALDEPVYRATPNVRSADGSPLAALGNSTVTSVAPGADGRGGLGAFAGRDGVRNFDYFGSSGGLAASLNSLDYAYGRRQRREAYFGSAVYDIFPWLQIGLDGTHVSTVVNRGYDILNGDLDLSATSPFNPFGEDVKVSLNEITPSLGGDYSEARLASSSAVLGLLVKMPAEWQASFDVQYARNLTRYRGLAVPDAGRWQELVNEGLYNPLRDTQAGGAPAAFYDRAVVYYGGRGRFAKLGDYDTLDLAARVTNRNLTLPTGRALLNFGGDYRRNHLAPYTDERRFGDGALAEEPVRWTGRTLQRYSGFGEVQAPLVPERWLPRGLRKVEADVAVRYVAADTASETNVAPTLALKAELAGGILLRGSVTKSNRFPTPQMSRRIEVPGGTGGTGSDVLVEIKDLRRGDQVYEVIADEIIDAGLSTEGSVTQTAGAVWERGQTHRWRLALDFVDTRKVNELVSITNPQDVIALEPFFPERVFRAPLAPGDPNAVGRVTSLLTGAVNLASRHSQNWNTSVDYVWNECVGGTLELYGRWLYFQRYDRELVPGAAPVDELDAPSGSASALLRHRLNFGASWSTAKYGFGLDGHYFSARTLPVSQWAEQGASRIKPYWQFDAFLQGDLARFLPWKNSRYGLRGQLRVNNISGFDYPKFVYEASGAGVQPYGDWRGRTYSVSVTATF